MTLNFRKTYMMRPVAGERLTTPVWRVFAFFMAIFGISSLARGVITGIAVLLVPTISPTASMLVQLFATVSTVAAVLVYCLCFEKRDLTSLGVIPRGILPEYAIGLVAGVLLFGGAVGIGVLAGSMSVAPAAEPPSVWLLLLFLVGYLIQGGSEELMCRSYLMVSLSRGWPVWAAVVSNAGMFALLHIFNPGISVIALLNIFLFGVLASLLALKRGSIWMVAALHSAWNFAQGNLFGIPVSGLTGSPSPLTATLSDGLTWVSGGDFGIEGGLAATAVLLLGCGIVLLLPTKSREVCPDA